MKKLLLFALLVLSVSAFAQKQYTLQSPDKDITVTVEVGEQLTYSVTHGNTCVLAPSAIGMKLSDGTQLGQKPVVKSTKMRSVNQSVKAPFYKRAQIPEIYEELTLTLKGNYKVIFRAYDEGMAYRFETDFRKQIIVENETADFNFDADYQGLIPYVNARKGEGDFINQQFYNSFENTYTHTALSKMEPERLASSWLPFFTSLSYSVLSSATTFACFSCSPDQYSSP